MFKGEQLCVPRVSMRVNLAQWKLKLALLVEPKVLLLISMNVNDIPMGEYHKKCYYDNMLHSQLSFSLMST